MCGGISWIYEMFLELGCGGMEVIMVVFMVMDDCGNLS